MTESGRRVLVAVLLVDLIGDGAEEVLTNLVAQGICEFVRSAEFADDTAEDVEDGGPLHRAPPRLERRRMSPAVDHRASNSVLRARRIRTCRSTSAGGATTAETPTPEAASTPVERGLMGAPRSAEVHLQATEFVGFFPHFQGQLTDGVRSSQNCENYGSGGPH